MDGGTACMDTRKWQQYEW